MHALRHLSHAALLRLADALDGGRVAPPFSGIQVEPYVPGALVAGVAAALGELSSAGMTPLHLARMARLLAEERAAAQAAADKIQLVWSGIEVEDGTRSRETGTAVQELFRMARRSVLVASYVLDPAKAKARAIFGALAQRMDEEPRLSVRLYVNVKRDWRDERTDAELLREFADAFRGKLWPGARLPEVFYDPRALTSGGKTRACLHAKCIVVDEAHVFISSANFTEAAHARNIEAGVRIDDRQIAQALRIQFETLAERKMLRRVPGLSSSV